MRDHPENVLPNIEIIIPIADIICDQNNLSHPDLSPSLSPEYAQSASPADARPMSTWITIQIDAPRVTIVRSTHSHPRANSETMPRIPKIKASHGARVMSISLIF